MLAPTWLYLILTLPICTVVFVTEQLPREQTELITMAPPTLVPDRTTLSRWQGEGLTHQQMAERHYEETGILVTRTAISAAMVRYGLAEDGVRYKDMIPWRVKVIHAKAYPVRMLRLLGRRNSGGELNELEEQALERWLQKMAEDRTIVAYDEDSDAGFFYIDKRHKDHRGAAPIRKKQIKVNETALL